MSEYDLLQKRVKVPSFKEIVLRYQLPLGKQEKRKDMGPNFLFSKTTKETNEKNKRLAKDKKGLPHIQEIKCSSSRTALPKYFYP